MQFNVDAKKETFVEVDDAIRRDMGKLPIYEMPPIFYSTFVAGPLQQYCTLENFFESYLSLEKYPDALTKIVSLLH